MHIHVHITYVGSNILLTAHAGSLSLCLLRYAIRTFWRCWLFSEKASCGEKKRLLMVGLPRIVRWWSTAPCSVHNTHGWLPSMSVLTIFSSHKYWNESPLQENTYVHGYVKTGKSPAKARAKANCYLLYLTIRVRTVGEGVPLSERVCMTCARTSTSSSFSCSDVGDVTSFLSLAAITPRWSNESSRKLCSVLRLLKDCTWNRKLHNYQISMKSDRLSL